MLTDICVTHASTRHTAVRREPVIIHPNTDPRHKTTLLMGTTELTPRPLKYLKSTPLPLPDIYPWVPNPRRVYVRQSRRTHVMFNEAHRRRGTKIRSHL